MAGNYFQDDFHVSTYNKFRPSPPENMIEEIIRFTSEKISGPLELAVDVGCGSGQSTEVFASHFNKVLGIDVSLSIVREAKAKSKYSNVNYSQGSGENIPVDNESVTLLSVCQALHWFNLPKFYEEAERVLCKNGVLAVYGYQLPIPIVEGAHECLSSIVRKYYVDVLGDFVLPESKKVYLETYEGTEFNYVSFIDGGRMQRLSNFYCDVEGTINDLTGYLTSWSTYQNYAKHVGDREAEKIIENFKNDFNNCLGREIDFRTKFKIRYNYFVLLGRKK